jgi:hypothetical protein
MSVGSVDAGVLGDVGPSPPQAETNVASAAHDAAWHAPAQNCLREMNSFASDIARNPCDLGDVVVVVEGGKIEAVRNPVAIRAIVWTGFALGEGLVGCRLRCGARRPRFCNREAHSGTRKR